MIFFHSVFYLLETAKVTDITLSCILATMWYWSMCWVSTSLHTTWYMGLGNAGHIPSQTEKKYSPPLVLIHQFVWTTGGWSYWSTQCHWTKLWSRTETKNRVNFEKIKKEKKGWLIRFLSINIILFLFFSKFKCWFFRLFFLACGSQPGVKFTTELNYVNRIFLHL